MHLQIILRGINDRVELWKILAQNNFFKFKRTEDGEEKTILFQMALRPSVLGTWELIFPETALPTVLSMLGLIDEKKGIYGNISMKGTRMAVLRKCCGVKKIPKKTFEEAAKIPHSIELQQSERGLSSLILPGVAIHQIGIRKDKYGELTDEAGRKYFQELL